MEIIQAKKSSLLIQNDLLQRLFREAQGHTAGEIKGAAVNLLCAVLTRTSSNVDEAIIQWNEMSTAAEAILRKKVTFKLGSTPEDFSPFQHKLQGDK